MRHIDLIKIIWIALFLSFLIFSLTPRSQTALAQEKLSSTAPLTSLHTEEDPSDQQLIDRAKTLLEARADAKISHSTYREGVRYFKKNHPEFYGAFFGDPFYASYDVRYFRLTRKRRFVNVEVNPHSSLRSSTWFFCHPSSYDPAFNGQCRGISYAQTDFFLLPMAFKSFSPAEISLFLANRGGSPHETHKSRDGVKPDTTRDERIQVSEGEIDVMNTPSSGMPILSLPAQEQSEFGIAKPAEVATQPEDTDYIRLPGNLSSRMEESASSMEKMETILRIRQEISQRREKREWSATDRAELARRIAAEEGEDVSTEFVSEFQRKISRAKRKASSLPEARRAERSVPENRNSRDRASTHSRDANSQGRRMNPASSDSDDNDPSRSSQEKSSGS